MDSRWAAPEVECSKTKPVSLGARVYLRRAGLDAETHHPSHVWPGEQSPKALRVDLSFEQWARTRDGAFSFLGEGRDVGPVLFETGKEHQLLLWVTDRRGAEARKLCRFEVLPQE